MSSQLHDGESDRPKQVKFRAAESLVEDFDEAIEESTEYSSRAEGLRAAMSQMTGTAGESPTPRRPPTDNEALRNGYLTLVEIANPDGIIPHELAVSELSTTLGKSQKVIERAVIAKLRNRGYLRQQTNYTATNRSWKLRGFDDE